MSNLLEQYAALRKQLLAAVVTSPSKPKRKSVKTERKAAKATAKAGRKAAKAVPSTPTQILGWQLPVSFSQWLKWNYSGVSVVDAELGGVSDFMRLGWDYAQNAGRDVLLAQARVRKQYEQYKNAKFNEPIRFNGTDGNSFDKIVRREEFLERQGKHDLGLLGYSAIDRVQLAVHHAYVKNVVRYIKATGCDKAYADQVKRALLDLRSDAELKRIAELDGRSRFTVEDSKDGKFPRIRKQEQKEVVSIAALHLQLRAEVDDLLSTMQDKKAKYVEGQVVEPFAYSSLMPTVGQVYKQLFAVTKEGLRKFRNTLEGLTLDGVISDQTQYATAHLQDLSEAGLDRAIAAWGSARSAEEIYFDKEAYAMLADGASLDEVKALYNQWSFDEVHVRRQAIASAVKLLPATSDRQVNAQVALAALADGMSLPEMQAGLFPDLSSRAFSQLFRDAKALADEAQASDVFIVTLQQGYLDALDAQFTIS